MRPILSLLCLALISIAAPLRGHPIPDIPVRGSFEADGTCVIRVEVDPRCFEADWEEETYLLHIQLNKLMSAADQSALTAKTNAFVKENVEFIFEPQGRQTPTFKWNFTTLGGGPLVNIDDPVMVTGTWRTKVPEGFSGYCVRAGEGLKFAVVFENHLKGKPVERTAVLFPGEKSFLLDMEGKNSVAGAAPPELTAETAPKDTPESRPWLWVTISMAAALAALWGGAFAKWRQQRAG